jgi:hypothetical protein
MRNWRGLTIAAAVVALAAAACGQQVAGSATVDTAGLATASSSAPTTEGSAVTTPSAPPTTASPSGSATASSEPAPPPSPDTSGTEPTPTPSGSAESSAGGNPLYPTTPQDIPEHPTTDASAATLEGRRLANYVLVPTFFDKAYTESGSLSTLAFKGPASLGVLFGDAPVETVADRLGMYAGFSTARSTKDGDELVISVMVFPNAAAATKASKQLADAAKTKQADFRAATLKGYPEAHGWAGKYDSIDSRYLHTFLAHGPLVIYVWMSTTIKGDKYLHDVVPKVYDQQIALLKGYTPTPEAKLKEQKVDPEGLLARTLPNSPDNGTVNDGWYQASGMLHFVVNPNDDKPIFDTAGIDLVTRDGSTVYRAKDATGAKYVVDGFVKESAGYIPSFKDMSAPPGADYARCLQDSLAAQYYCVAQYGRYAVEISTSSEADMAQAVSAQGKLLAGF